MDLQFLLEFFAVVLWERFHSNFSSLCTLLEGRAIDRKPSWSSNQLMRDLEWAGYLWQWSAFDLSGLSNKPIGAFQQRPSCCRCRNLEAGTLVLAVDRFAGEQILYIWHREQHLERLASAKAFGQAARSGRCLTRVRRWTWEDSCASTLCASNDAAAAQALGFILIMCVRIALCQRQRFSSSGNCLGETEAIRFFW